MNNKFGKYFLLKKELDLTPTQINNLTQTQQINPNFIILTPKQNKKVDIVYKRFVKIYNVINNKIKTIIKKGNTNLAFNNQTLLHTLRYNTDIQDILKNGHDNYIVYISAFSKYYDDNEFGAKIILNYFLKSTQIGSNFNFYKQIMGYSKKQNIKWFSDFLNSDFPVHTSIYDNVPHQGSGDQFFNLL